MHARVNTTSLLLRMRAHDLTRREVTLSDARTIKSRLRVHSHFEWWLRVVLSLKLSFCFLLGTMNGFKAGLLSFKKRVCRRLRKKRTRIRRRAAAVRGRIVSALRKRKLLTKLRLRLRIRKLVIAVTNVIAASTTTLIHFPYKPRTKEIAAF